MLLPNGSAIKNDVIESFNAAVANDENVRADGSIEWNFVDADLNIALGGFYSSDYLYECFDVLVDNYFDKLFEEIVAGVEKEVDNIA